MLSRDSRPSSATSNRYAAIVSTLALVFSIAALCLGGAMATGVLVGTKQIRNGSILTQDIHNGTLKSADIGTGQVMPQDMTMPPPDQLQGNDVATSQVGGDFTLVDSIGNYDKQDATSELEVDWTGTASAGNSPCIFQIRVDGQPSSSAAGELFVAVQSTISVSATSLFDGLPTGAHSIEIWAKAGNGMYPTSKCTIGPASAGIEQTVVVSEQVV